jgi:hypothetical protein
MSDICILDTFQVLDMAEPPYSDEFIELFVEIIEPIAESLDKAMDVKTIVWEFLSKYLQDVKRIVRTQIHSCCFQIMH